MDAITGFVSGSRNLFAPFFKVNSASVSLKHKGAGFGVFFILLFEKIRIRNMC